MGGSTYGVESLRPCLLTALLPASFVSWWGGESEGRDKPRRAWARSLSGQKGSLKDRGSQRQRVSQYQSRCGNCRCSGRMELIDSNKHKQSLSCRKVSSKTDRVLCTVKRNEVCLRQGVGGHMLGKVGPSCANQRSNRYKPLQIKQRRISTGLKRGHWLLEFPDL